MKDWRIAATVPVGVLLSALLCFWLAQNLLERVGRDQHRITLLEQRDRLSADVVSQVQEQQDLLLWFARQPNESIDDPAISALTVARLRAAHRGQPNRLSLSGLVLVQLPALTVIDSDDESLPIGEQVDRAAPRNALLNLASAGQSATAYVLVDGDVVDMWQASASHSDESVAVLTRVAMKFATTDALRLDFGPFDSPFSESLDQMLEVSHAGAQVYQVRGVAEQTRPLMRFVVRSMPSSAGSDWWRLGVRLFGVGSLVALLLTALVWRWLRGSHTSRLPTALVSTLDGIKRGDLNRRSRLDLKHDPQGYAQTIDQLLEQHQNLARSMAVEQSKLVESSEQIAAAVNEMAQRGELNGTVPVTSDVTGTIADSINVLVSQTNRVIARIGQNARELSLDIARLRKGATQFESLSTQHRQSLERAVSDLTDASSGMESVLNSREQADNAVDAIRQSHAQNNESIDQMLKSLGLSRQHVHQTEKRIKSVAERSQEITQAVAKVADLSERTGMLALNASLQAVAAGPVGREFAALADEVKRLADSGSGATEQIGQLVRAIHDESTQAIMAINASVSSLVDATQKSTSVQATVRSADQSADILQTELRQLLESAGAQLGLAQSLNESVTRATGFNAKLHELIVQQTKGVSGLSKSAERILSEARAVSGNSRADDA